MERKTLLGIVVISLLCAPVLAAQDYGNGLFVSSAPIRAEVVLDGTPVGTTPLLVRDLEPGEHQVSFVKPGYLVHTSTVEVVSTAFAQYNVILEPSLFVGAFAAAETIVAGTAYSRQDARLVLPAGTYEFSQSGSSLSLDPVYPYESVLRGLRVATPVIVVSALIATVEDLLVQDSARSYFTSFLPSPATFAAWTTAAASSGFLIALNRDKRQYEADTVVRELETELTEAEAERYYLEGERALTAGNLGTALTNYTRVVVDGGDSEYVPQALYKAGRIYSISGENDLALPLFEILVKLYPTADTYDRAQKSISDIHLSNGDSAEAIAALESMVFIDELYDPADIRADIQSIRETMSTEGGSL